MIIEDDVDSRELFEECLRAEGWDVITADTAEKALVEIQAQGIPHLIFMDLNFPGMKPAEFLESLRQHTEGQQVPVVVLSGDAHIEEICQKLKVQAFLKKPFNIDQFVGMSQKWMGQENPHSCG